MQEILQDAAQLTDEELVPLIVGGDKNLFELIIRRYNQKLYRVGKAFRISDETGKDLLQQTYLNVYQNLFSFKGESSLSTWINKIHINECLKHLKKNKKEFLSYHDILPENFEYDHTMENNELKRVLEDSINKLPDSLRVVYVFREVQGLSIKETCDALELSEGNVKVRLHRAKDQLKSILLKTFSQKEIWEFNGADCDSVSDKFFKSI